MNNAEAILKRAFVDAQLADINNTPYVFSDGFERRIRRIGRKRYGALRLINTAGKRVACIALAAILVVTTAVFGVGAIREPLIEAFKAFFVNVQTELTGTNASNIADAFPTEVKEIVATNFITSIPKEYLIDDGDKIKDFTALLASTTWSTPKKEHDADTKYVFWKFEFIGADGQTTTLNLCGMFSEKFGIAEIIHDGKSSVYNVSCRAYLDMLAFTTQKYYLHQSGINIPEKEFCSNAQVKALSGLNDTEKSLVCESLRNAHIMMEILLLDNVSVLKEPDSLYWHPAITGERFEDPFSHEIYINGNASFNGVLRQLETAVKVLKDAETKKALEIVCKDLRSACDNRDIGSLFTVHESIHDFDYWNINYPAYFPLIAPPDWAGVNVYFGRLDSVYSD